MPNTGACVFVFLLVSSVLVWVAVQRNDINVYIYNIIYKCINVVSSVITYILVPDSFTEEGMFYGKNEPKTT